MVKKSQTKYNLERKEYVRNRPETLLIFFVFYIVKLWAAQSEMRGPNLPTRRTALSQASIGRGGADSGGV
jgi:hypothetical protein